MARTYIFPCALQPHPSCHRRFYPSLLIFSTTILIYYAIYKFVYYNYCPIRQDELIYNTIQSDGRHFEFVNVRSLSVTIDASECTFSELIILLYKHGTA